MTTQLLPKYIEPLKLADRAARLQGSLALVGLARLQDFLADSTGNVEAALIFGRDSEGYKYVEGTITATLSLICQRCMQKMDYTIQTAVHLSPVKSEEAAKRLPERYDPLLLEENETVFLVVLIEDELLLNLPLVPKHAEDCVNLSRD